MTKIGYDLLTESSFSHVLIPKNATEICPAYSNELLAFPNILKVDLIPKNIMCYHKCKESCQLAECLQYDYQVGLIGSAYMFSETFPFLSLFSYGNLLPEVEFFQATSSDRVGFCCTFIVTSWKQRFEVYSYIQSFYYRPSYMYFFLGTNLHDGLWHSLSINARRHRITLTLDNNAATANHATTVSRIYSGNSYYFGGRLFQMDTWQIFMI